MGRCSSNLVLPIFQWCIPRLGTDTALTVFHPVNKTHGMKERNVIDRFLAESWVLEVTVTTGDSTTRNVHVEVVQIRMPVQHRSCTLRDRI